jgi:hypothetical protein
MPIALKLDLSDSISDGVKDTLCSSQVRPSRRSSVAHQCACDHLVELGVCIEVILGQDTR